MNEMPWSDKASMKNYNQYDIREYKDMLFVAHIALPVIISSPAFWLRPREVENDIQDDFFKANWWEIWLEEYINYWNVKLIYLIVHMDW